MIFCSPLIFVYALLMLINLSIDKVCSTDIVGFS